MGHKRCEGERDQQEIEADLPFIVLRYIRKLKKDCEQDGEALSLGQDTVGILARQFYLHKRNGSGLADVN